MERYFLDTNIVRRILLDVSLLSQEVYSLLFDSYVELNISVETVREMIIDYNNVKKSELRKKWRTKEDMIDSIIAHQFIIRDLTLDVMDTYAALEIRPDHNDPSDHIIIAHAITMNMPLISSDGKFSFYRKQGLDLIVNY